MTGASIGGGVQGVVYDASPTYNEYMAKHVLNEKQFVVKVIDYEEESQAILYNNDVYDDITHKLTVYDKINTHKPPHVLPCVHWTVYFNERFHLDSSVNSIQDIRTIPVRKLSMTFPKLEGTLWDEILNMSPLKRKDACLQMVGALKSLHEIGITHEDFHLENIMYRKNSRGYYDLYVIDLDYANYSGSIARDYRYLVNNITLIMYGEFFDSCRMIQFKPELHNCLKTLKDKSNTMEVRTNAFHVLGLVLSRTTFYEEEVFWG